MTEPALTSTTSKIKAAAFLIWSGLITVCTFAALGACRCGLTPCPTSTTTRRAAASSGSFARRGATQA